MWWTRAAKVVTTFCRRYPCTTVLPVCLRDGFLRTSQTSSLAMLDGGPYQGVLESYVGLPLMTGHGELYGTFCHFDFSSEPVSDEEYLFLQKAVLLIPRFLRHAARSKTDPSLRLQVPGR